MADDVRSYLGVVERSRIKRRAWPDRADTLQLLCACLAGGDPNDVNAGGLAETALLPAGVLIVLAGRVPPTAGWWDEPLVVWLPAQLVILTG